MSTQIYTGVWTDWTLGRVSGATLTLSARTGATFLSFLAFFVTLVGARTWRLVGFIAHQALAKDGAHDGLYYQRQHILRNTITPADATWQFLQQSWHWRKTVQRGWLRTVPWAVCAAAYLCLFAAASIFSSLISDAASEYRLLAPTNCGFASPTSSESFLGLRGTENEEAATYARQCYDDNSTSAACDIFCIRSLPWRNGSSPCPFDSSVCLPGFPAFRMATDLLDSHYDLGINDAPPNRISYRRETLCSPLVTRNLETNTSFIQQLASERNGVAYNATIRYYYGQLNGPRGRRSNYTYSYNTDNFDGNTGYSVGAFRSYPEEPRDSRDSHWVPIKELQANRSDVTLMFIAHNSIMHLEQNNDPIFGAHYENYDRGDQLYMTDRPVSPIACIDRYSICNPNSKEKKCTPPQASNTLGTEAELKVLGLNSAQRATAMRLAVLSQSQSFYDLIFTRVSRFLQIQYGLNLLHYRVPDDQWKREMGALFSDALSYFQHQIMRYPIGPPPIGNISVVKLWLPEPGVSAQEAIIDDPIVLGLGRMCHNQKVRMTDGTINFSILGLGIMIGIGSILIALSFFMEPAVSFIQKRTGIGAVKASHWERDNYLQTMRMLYEANGAGDWEGPASRFPRTKSGQTFEYRFGSREEYRTLTQYSEEDVRPMMGVRSDIRRKPVAVISAMGV
ncbi:hypothetical protein B0T11DRAFT_126143 [Plectosphaerella cucumerina]|uniref:Uncharacterized protein n=1 Tax=Plectosphaerella cucumerina TaxID=40658 RepID=A0A8K0TC61_9PEZI|nr:hypothetical protein B0T11DRAFT_126143 [Plectosphaerella cucumerina]